MNKMLVSGIVFVLLFLGMQGSVNSIAAQNSFGTRSWWEEVPQPNYLPILDIDCSVYNPNTDLYEQRNWCLTFNDIDKRDPTGIYYLEFDSPLERTWTTRYAHMALDTSDPYPVRIAAADFYSLCVYTVMNNGEVYTAIIGHNLPFRWEKNAWFNIPTRDICICYSPGSPQSPIERSYFILDKDSNSIWIFDQEHTNWQKYVDLRNAPIRGKAVKFTVGYCKSGNSPNSPFIFAFVTDQGKVYTMRRRSSGDYWQNRSISGGFALDIDIKSSELSTNWEGLCMITRNRVYHWNTSSGSWMIDEPLPSGKPVQLSVDWNGCPWVVTDENRIFRINPY